MRICFFKVTVLEHGGGLENFFIETAQKFAQDEQNKVDVVSLTDIFTERVESLLSLYYLKNKKNKSIIKEKTETILLKLGRAGYSKCRINELIKKMNQYDIIYSKNEILEALVLKYFVGFNKIPPVIFGVHTPIKYPIANTVTARLHNFIYNGSIYKYLSNCVTAFHVLNSSDEIAIRKLHPKKNIYQVPNPFDSKTFYESANIKPCLDKKTIKILWVGRLTEQKGVVDLINIIKYINQNLRYISNNVEWNIVGSGELSEMVKECCRDNVNVKYYGYIPHELIANIYIQNDIFISTSKWEGYPYNILEALSFGLDIFSYKIPGPAEILKDILIAHLLSSIADYERTLFSFLKTYKIEEKRINRRSISVHDKETIYQKLINVFKYEAIHE